MSNSLIHLKQIRGEQTQGKQTHSERETLCHWKQTHQCVFSPKIPLPTEEDDAMEGDIPKTPEMQRRQPTSTPTRGNLAPPFVAPEAEAEAKGERSRRRSPWRNSSSRRHRRAETRVCRRAWNKTHRRRRRQTQAKRKRRRRGNHTRRTSRQQSQTGQEGRRFPTRNAASGAANLHRSARALREPIR